MVKKRKPKDPAWIRVIKRVNIFFLRMKRREVLTFLVFLFISALFWVIQSASEVNDATYTVEFRVDGQPANFVFTTPVPRQLKVSITDKNINLLNYTYNNTIDTLAVDFSRYTDASGNFRVSGAELQALLINRLFPSTQITSLNPSLIDAKFAIADGKMLPVVAQVDVTPASDFRCHKMVVSPDSVLVHAPSAVLDTMTMIRTELYESQNLKDTTRLTLPLQLGVGVKSTPEKVNIMLPVARFVEKTLKAVDIIVVDVPEGEIMTIFPNKTDVSFFVDFSKYNDISADDFYVTVSYNSIKETGQQFLPVEFELYADSEIVSNVRLHTSQVQYIIEISD